MGRGHTNLCTMMFRSIDAVKRVIARRRGGPGGLVRYPDGLFVDGKGRISNRRSARRRPTKRRFTRGRRARGPPDGARYLRAKSIRRGFPCLPQFRAERARPEAKSSDHGVERSRLTAKGCGEAHPLGDNSTDEGRAKNRRVESCGSNCWKQMRFALGDSVAKSGEGRELALLSRSLRGDAEQLADEFHLGYHISFACPSHPPFSDLANRASARRSGRAAIGRGDWQARASPGPNKGCYGCDGAPPPRRATPVPPAIPVYPFRAGVQTHWQISPNQLLQRSVRTAPIDDDSSKTHTTRFLTIQAKPANRLLRARWLI
jgi:hypothetical protein